jgi:monovalent cation:H+ antiporter, CPA1 family
VLATLLINATTLGPLVHRFRLDRPSRTDRFLAGSARLSGVATARARLTELGLEDPIINAALDEAEQQALAELAGIQLTPHEEFKVVTGRGLFVERDTYQRLTDAGLLPPAAARTLLDEVDDQIEAFSLDRPVIASVYEREPPFLDRLWERFTGWLPVGKHTAELTYAEASARRLAARRTSEAFGLFDRLPNVSPAAVAIAKDTFARWEQEAIESLAALDAQAGAEAAHGNRALRLRQAEALSRIASEDALDELAEIGLLPKYIARRAAQAIAAQVNVTAGT